MEGEGDLNDFSSETALKARTSDERLLAEAFPESPSSQDPLPKEVNDCQWAVLGSRRHVSVGKTTKKLCPGMYSIEKTERGIIFVRRPIYVDEFIKFPNSIADRILQEIGEFWSRGKLFQNHGFLHRRGYLLYGNQGSGKTIISQQIIADIIKRKGLVIQGDCNPGLLDDALCNFREVEPKRPIVCLFEDIDSIIRQYGEAQLLSVLDGENQIDTAINLATTNFPEELPKRIVARPRRFDRVIKIKFPDAATREIYFKEKLKINEDEIEKWVTASENFSFAACAEMVISVKCLGNSFEETVEKLKVLNVGKFSSQEFDGKVGFGTK